MRKNRKKEIKTKEKNVSEKTIDYLPKPSKVMLLILPVIAILMFFFFFNNYPREQLKQISLMITYFYLNALFLLMIYTGKTYKYRRILFVTIAALFVFSFIPELIETRGSMIVTEEDMINGQVPFCHIVIPMILIPAALTKTIIFPGSILTGFASIASMIVIWIGVSLSIGRGWCSWACFYGGFDEGFSSIPDKPLIRKLDRKWTYMPFAVLLAVVLTSAITLSPTYCEWLCPFKAVSEFAEITSFKAVIQTIIFFSLFLALVIILPILTKKRTQCTFLCPFGAFQQFTNRISPFDIRIDAEKCIKCNKCIKVCPTLSIDEKSLNDGKTLLSCTKCGKCIDFCPKNAVSYHIKGTKVGLKSDISRLFYLYPAFLFGSVLGSGIITRGLWRILKFITTGHII